VTKEGHVRIVESQTTQVFVADHHLHRASVPPPQAKVLVRLNLQEQLPLFDSRINFILMRYKPDTCG
jgi:hypothetical protein